MIPVPGFKMTDKEDAAESRKRKRKSSGTAKKKAKNDEHEEAKRQKRAQYMITYRAKQSEDKKKEWSLKSSAQRKMREEREETGAKKNKKLKQKLVSKKERTRELTRKRMNAYRLKQKLVNIRQPRANPNASFEDFVNRSETSDMFEVQFDDSGSNSARSGSPDYSVEIAGTVCSEGIDNTVSSPGNDTVFSTVERGSSNADAMKELERLRQENKKLKDALKNSKSPEFAANMKKSLSPKTRKKVVRAAAEAGPKTVVRSLGFRDRCRTPSSESSPSSLALKVQKFATRNSVPVPDKKRGIDKKGNLIRFRIDTLNILHAKFEATIEDISFSHFCRLFPVNVKIPRPDEWGTCLCLKCTNPKMKFLALIKIDLMEDFPDGPDNAVVPDVSALPQIVEFSAWEKKEGELKVKKCKKKYKRVKFIEELKEELRVWKSHLERAVNQFKAIKAAKIEAETGEAIVVQMDWSENFALRDSMEISSAFFGAMQISIHPMVCWTASGTYTAAAISDCRTHQASAVFASLTPVIQEWTKEKRFQKLVVVSDSPTSQYRNRWAVWLLQNLISQLGIPEATWIYTEVGHGKGPADGVGAAVKRKMTRAMAAPDAEIHCASQMKDALEEMGAGVRIHLYGEKDVAKVKKTKAFKDASVIKGIGKSHEVRINGESIVILERSGGKVLKSFSLISQGPPTPDDDEPPSPDDEKELAPNNSLLQREVFEIIEAGDYCVARFEVAKRKTQFAYYVGKIVEKKNKSFVIKCMVRKGSTWPPHFVETETEPDPLPQGE